MKIEIEEQVEKKFRKNWKIVEKKLRKVEEENLKMFVILFKKVSTKKLQKSWEKVAKELKKVEKQLKTSCKKVEKKLEKSWKKVGEKLGKSWEKVEKTLPEAQRTQGIESITWIIFLTEINLKLLKLKKIIQVLNSIPWVRCASGNVFQLFLNFFQLFCNFFSTSFSTFSQLFVTYL